MYTRCPHCLTLYRLDPDRLEAAAGQALCCRCKKAFVTEENRWVPSDSLTETDDSPQPNEIGPSVTDGRIKEQEGEPPDPLPLNEEEVVEEPDRLVAAPCAVSPSEPEQTTEDPAEKTEAPAIADEMGALPEELLSTYAKPKGNGLLWGLSALGLLFLLLGQVGWFWRNHLLDYPVVRTATKSICAVADCRIPPRHAPASIKVLTREMSAHPDIENALLLQLVISNDATFPQPYPVLELSLFTNEQKLVARRRFNPREYLRSDGRGNRLMRPRYTQRIRIELQDPGEQVSGYQLEFF